MQSAAQPAEAGRHALRGASVLILLQVASRAITFVANQLLLRFLTAPLLGVSTQLEVYYLSVIFFARESLRVAIQRQNSFAQNGCEQEKSTSNSTGAQAVVNLGYLSFALGIPLAVILGSLYLQSLSATTLQSAPNLVVSLYIYGFAAVLELASEPAFVVMQTRLQFGTRATAESFATFIRCLVTLASAAWGAGRGLGVLPFALGQLSYGFGLLVVYSWRANSLAKSEGFSLLPRRIPQVSSNDKPTESKPEIGQSDAPPSPFVLSCFYRPTLQLASSMMAQSVVKHILTQGDMFLVSIFSTPTAQGVYALANNYGGLLARLVFQPIEESSRSYFSRMLSPLTASVTLSSQKESADQLKGRTSDDRHHKAASHLQSLLKFYLLLSLVITTLGPAAAPSILALITGPRWAGSGAGDCLAAYMWYIPFLGVNGVVEAFVASVATEREVHQQSAWMGVFSAVFAIVGFVCLRVLHWDAIGLVVANAINMLCRIVWCGVFISRYFSKRGIRFDIFEVMPSPWALLAGTVTYPVVKRAVSAQPLASALILGVSKQAIVQLALVASIALPFMAVVGLSERKYLYTAIKAFHGGQLYRS